MNTKVRIVSKTINAKTKFFVVLSEGLLFMNDESTVVHDSRIVAEPVESLVTV
jgi:hypothetical protein